MSANAVPFVLDRRDFLKATGTALAACAWPANADDLALRFGLVTDLHYADTDMRMNRFYRESARKLRECVDAMNAEDVAFVCELGDFKDEDAPPVEANTLSYLRAIETEYARLTMPRHYVLGNHDLDSISKVQFLEGTAMESSYYSFDAGPLHFAVLDACFTKEGAPYDHGNFHWADTNVPQEELAWLKEDLAATERPTIILAHQRLDGIGPLFVNNAEEVRSVLEASERVLAVFTGHDHKGALSTINNIHYYTLVAVVEGAGEENNSFAIVNVAANGDLQVSGYRKALSKDLPRSV